MWCWKHALNAASPHGANWPSSPIERSVFNQLSVQSLLNKTVEKPAYSIGELLFGSGGLSAEDLTRPLLSSCSPPSGGHMSFADYRTMALMCAGLLQRDDCFHTQIKGSFSMACWQGAMLGWLKLEVNLAIKTENIRLKNVNFLKLFPTINIRF